MDPNEYDIDELRELDAGDEVLSGLDGRRTDPGDQLRADDVLQSGQYRELLLLERTTDDMERPYLSELPAGHGEEVTIFEWLEFLVDKAGYKRSLEILRYYRSVDWITEEVENRLRDHLVELDGHHAGSGAGFDRRDHLLSLIYVARLAAMQE